jgi:hypothetical protein
MRTASRSFALLDFNRLLGDARQRVVLFVSLGESILVDRHDFAVIEANQVVVDSQRFLGSVDLRDRTAAAMGEWNAETRDDCSPLAGVLAAIDADPVAGVKCLAHDCSFRIARPGQLMTDRPEYGT